MSQFPHTPILLSEWLEALQGKTLKVYLDATLGAGGHAEAILNSHPEIEHFFGIDQDSEALKIARDRLSPFSKESPQKLKLIHDSFSSFDRWIQYPIDAILFDIGVSSMQLDTQERGFSFSKCGPLDMRMNPDSTLTAQEIINHWEEKELSDIFWEYGEERKSRQAAKLIVHERKRQAITTTEDLVDVLKPLFPKMHSMPKHPLTRIFQALRIAVNDELNVLNETLPKAIDALASQGILGVITFHSLEDRIAKNIFREGASPWDSIDLPKDLRKEKTPKIRLVTKKPLVPSKEEMRKNPRSRSAKLRIVEKL